MSRRLLLGNTPRGVGLYIAQPGYDAANADDINLMFSSDWPSALAIADMGSIRLPGAGNASDGQYVTASYGYSSGDLGYIPFASFLAYPLAGCTRMSTYTPACVLTSDSMRDHVSSLNIRVFSNRFEVGYKYWNYVSSSVPSWPSAMALYYTIFRHGAANF